MPVLFFAFWLILNGRLTGEIVIIGLVIAVLVSVVSYRFFGASLSSERKALLKIFQIIGYLIALVGEVIKANLAMIALVLSPEIEIKPQIIYFNSPLRADLARVALANSITLTPGTITVLLEDGKFGIHTVDAPMAVGIESSKFVSRLKKIEGGH